MGGQLEDTINPSQQSTPKESLHKPADDPGILMPTQYRSPGTALPAVSLNQAVRFHVNDGEVHFHVDKGLGPNSEDLKVAIPVGEWYQAWDQVKNLRGNYRYVDHENGCLLEVEAGLDENGAFDVIPRLSKIANGSGQFFEKLERFTENTITVKKKKK